MKNPIFRISILIALLFMFNACQKEEITRPTGGSSAFLNNNPLVELRQKVLFQVGELDANGNVTEGWLITKYGDINEFKFDDAITNWDPSESECTYDEMKSLKEVIGQQIDEVDLDELTDNFEKVEDAAALTPTLTMVDPNESSIAYIAFIQDEEHVPSNENTPENSTGGDNHCKDYNYKKVLLSIEGGIEATNEANSAKEIMIWLKGIQLEHNL